jgi:hypothetical protein
MSNFVTLGGRIKKIPNIGKYAIRWNGESRSKLQKKVKDILFQLWRGHVVYEEFPVVGTRSTLDFYNSTLKIAIEVQGNQHVKHIPHFHGTKLLKFVDQLKRDMQKVDFCEKNSITFVEIMETDDINLEFIKEKLNQ